MIYSHPYYETHGGMLTGSEILKQVNNGSITITPFDKSRINPNSYNLRLDKDLKIYDIKDYNTIDAFEKNVNFLDMHSEPKIIDIMIPEEGIILVPNRLYIARTIERAGSSKFIPMINGRSSGGRYGMSIHICAGFGDIGFDGTWTLEITVVHPLKVYAGDEVAQVSFFVPHGETKYQYKGRYQGQIDATPSKFYLPKPEGSTISDDFEEKSELEELDSEMGFIYGFDPAKIFMTNELLDDAFYMVDDDLFIHRLEYDLSGEVIKSDIVGQAIYSKDDGRLIYVWDKSLRKGN